MPYVNNKRFFCDPLSISRIILYAILLILSCVILWDTNWVFDMFWADDYQLVGTTAIGKNAHSYTGNGRFWPLGLCDYCLLLLIPYGKTVTAHFLYNCVTMIFASVMLFSFIDRVTENKNNYIALFCMLLLFLTSSFMRIHMTCIYSEREMFLMLSAFLISYWKACNKKTGGGKYYAIAAIAAMYSTYLKEPVFGMWCIFALSNLIFGKLSLKERLFNYFLLFNSFIWVSIYAYRCFFVDLAFIDPNAPAPYSSIVSKLSDLSITVFNSEPIIYLLLIIAIIRCCLLLKRKTNYYNMYSDAPLFAGVGYAFAYVILNQRCNHYFFPSVVMGLPAFAVFLSECTKYVRALLISISIGIAIFSFNASLYWITEIQMHRKKDPLIFARMIDEVKQGKKVIYVTEKGKDLSNIDSGEIDQMKFRRWQIFLDYYWGGKFPIIKTADYSKINKDSVVILSDETYGSANFQEISERLKISGLALSQSFQDMKTRVFRTK